MRIPLTEPVSPRYIHINTATNLIHLMVPIVGGQEISTDNTCKSTVALRDFFDGGALRELTAYKNSLIFDIGVLPAGTPEQEAKETRLAQIEVYIEALSVMRYSYGDAVAAFLGKPSNLYSIQLRPRAQDSASRVINPVFTVNRTNDASGTPGSALYNALYSIFPITVIARCDLRTRLMNAVLGVLSASARFEDIQRVLGEQSLALLGLSIDFTQRTNGSPVTKNTIDALMGFGFDATIQDYIHALLGDCAPNIWETLTTPPFYSIPATTPVSERTEQLSILTQFFLAILNVYCKAKSISTKNFGVVLDESSILSNELISKISSTLSRGDDVESAIYIFCNKYKEQFKLSRSLNKEDLAAIRQKFERNYRTITATKENPHMDDFLILDLEAAGEIAKFVTHQGSICVNLAELIDPIAASSNPGYFASIRADFANHPTEIPHRNESISGEAEVDIERLVASMNDDQFENLPQALRVHPSFQTRLFLQAVAKGKPDKSDKSKIKTEAEVLLMATPTNKQMVLRTPGFFTDYSGRTFNCTAYEYAYWAKDTHMCRMLERHMDDETKAIILARIDRMETEGLPFQQNSAEHRSSHFDLAPLKKALHEYVEGFSEWCSSNNWAAIDTAWLNVGKAQRDVPAHVAQEYCRKDRSFYPCPSFNEPTLPRVLTYYNWANYNWTTYYWPTYPNESWFPLSSSNSGLGSNFSLIRANRNGTWVAGQDGSGVAGAPDLEAIRRLDEVRTADLTLSREHLNPQSISHTVSW